MQNYIINTNPSFIDEQVGNNANVEKNVFDDSVYLDTRLKPNEKKREVIIRILPISANCADLWAEVRIHGLKLDKHISKSGYKSYMCLNKDKGDRVCPLCAKGTAIWQEAVKAESEGKEDLAKSLKTEARRWFAKDAYIVRCIERGKENEGVKFWRFNGSVKGDGLKEKLIGMSQSLTKEMAENGIPNYYMFDLERGRDVKLILTEGFSNNGERITNINLQAGSFDKPLSPDVEQVNRWLSDTKTWKDVYSKKNPEYLSIIADGNVPVKNKTTGLYEGVDPSKFNKTNGNQQQDAQFAQAPVMAPIQPGYAPQQTQQGNGYIPAPSVAPMPQAPVQPNTNNNNANSNLPF